MPEARIKSGYAVTAWSQVMVLTALVVVKMSVMGAEKVWDRAGTASAEVELPPSWYRPADACNAHLPLPDFRFGEG